MIIAHILLYGKIERNYSEQAVFKSLKEVTNNSKYKNPKTRRESGKICNIFFSQLNQFTLLFIWCLTGITFSGIQARFQALEGGPGESTTTYHQVACTPGIQTVLALCSAPGIQTDLQPHAQLQVYRQALAPGIQTVFIEFHYV